MFPWFWILFVLEFVPVSEASGRYKSYDYYMYYCGNGVAVERERICDGVSDCQVHVEFILETATIIAYSELFSRMTNLTAPPGLSMVAIKVPFALQKTA